jgi:hypothetical protein
MKLISQTLFKFCSFCNLLQSKNAVSSKLMQKLQILQNCTTKRENKADNIYKVCITKYLVYYLFYIGLYLFGSAILQSLQFGCFKQTDAENLLHDIADIAKTLLGFTFTNDFKLI